MLSRVLAISLIFLGLTVQKAYSSPAPESEYSEFFTISEHIEKTPEDDQDQLNPIKIVSVQAEELIKKINLLVWKHFNSPLPAPAERYDRKKHFGVWITDHRDNSCMTTRAKVLVRDSQEQVKMNPNGCSVKSGSWYDPSVDRTFTDATFMEIDHFVPLKNVYISGAWKWTPAQRCLYYNYMGNSIHLVPFNRTENRVKSDNTPERYMPPERSYRCEYLNRWLTVKAIWKIAINPNEAAAIIDHVKRENCDESTFKLDEAFIKQQRRTIRDNLEMCQGNFSSSESSEEEPSF